jgi:predicted transposase/invertase (TIGR01784 family)
MNLKVYRDYKNTEDTAFEKGINEGALKVARQLKKDNVDIEIIIKSTGLSKEQILRLY